MLSRLWVLNSSIELPETELLIIAQKQNETPEILNMDYKTFKIGEIDILIDNKNRIIIPDQISHEFLYKLHEKLIHPGTRQFTNTIRKYFFVKNITRIALRINRSCNVCNLNKKLKSNYGIISGGLESGQPHDIVSSDIFGPLKTRHFQFSKDNDYFYILTITELFSRYTECFIINDIRASTITEIIKKWINKFGPPKKFLTDQGRQYISREFNEMLNKYNTFHILTSPHNPMCNGISERINQTLAEVCRISRGTNKKTLLNNIHTRLNFLENRNTAMTPHEIIFKNNPFIDIPRLENNNLMRIKEKIKEIIKKEEIKRNKKRRIDHIFKKGDKVFVKNFFPDKLEPIWKGPFDILEISKCKNRVTIKETTKTSIQNIKNLRPFLGGGKM